MSAKRARKHVNHTYAGEKQPSPLTLQPVCVTMVGKRKKARVVTGSYGVQRSDDTSNRTSSIPETPIASTSNSTPTQVIDDPIRDDDGDVRMDNADAQDPPPKKVSFPYYLLAELTSFLDCVRQNKGVYPSFRSNPTVPHGPRDRGECWSGLFVLRCDEIRDISLSRMFQHICTLCDVYRSVPSPPTPSPDPGMDWNILQCS